MNEDLIDEMSREMMALHPDLDLSGFAVTGRAILLASHLDSRREEVLGGFGLTLADYDVLATLSRQSAAHRAGVNPKDLQRGVMISSGGLTKRVDRLENAGLVRRGADPHDRRGVLVSLTVKGRRLFGRALPAVLDEEHRFVRDALGSDAAMESLAKQLRRLLLHAGLHAGSQAKSTTPPPEQPE